MDDPNRTALGAAGSQERLVVDEARETACLRAVLNGARAPRWRLGFGCGANFKSCTHRRHSHRLRRCTRYFRHYNRCFLHCIHCYLRWCHSRRFRCRLTRRHRTRSCRSKYHPQASCNRSNQRHRPPRCRLRHPGRRSCSRLHRGRRRYRRRKCLHWFDDPIRAAAVRVDRPHF